MILIKVVPGIECPVCGAPEVDPSRPVDHPSVADLPEDSLLRFSWWVRAFKVDNWSKCNWCGAWFDEQGNIDHSGILPGWKPFHPQIAE